MYGGFALLDHSLLLFSLVDYNGSCHLGKVIQVHFITMQAVFSEKFLSI